MDEFRSAGAEVVATSVDSPWAQKQFADATGYNGTLVSDFNHEIGQAYGVFNPDALIDRRAVFIIDKSGAIRYTWLAGPGEVPNNPELLDVLRKL
ncbi:MAG: redoxin domain-containing protein [Chloroflexi bacterium]|nr:redoxin domain-containing protein [Chloroflexota bacterium]